MTDTPRVARSLGDLRAGQVVICQVGTTGKWLTPVEISDRNLWAPTFVSEDRVVIPQRVIIIRNASSANEPRPWTYLNALLPATERPNDNEGNEG